MSEDYAAIVEARLDYLKRSVFCIWSECNSVCREVAGPGDLDRADKRRRVRKVVFYIQSEIDQIQQLLDEITYGLNDLEAADLMQEPTDHGHYKKGPF